MVFSSTTFLFAFLPLVVVAYHLAPRRLRNLTLLTASVLFYVWGSGRLITILLTSTAIDYCAGWLANQGRIRDRRPVVIAAVALSVVTNLGLLAYFKYSNFVVGEMNALAARTGWSPVSWAEVVLPIGISFYTFQSMSYTIDIAQGRARPLRNPVDFALYVVLFPQLVAGPIVRFHEIAGELSHRVRSLDQVSAGAVRFAHGLVKKVLVADTVAVLADAAFAAEPGSLGLAAAWLGIVAYTIQIYFDFSGYSDMAIGLGMIFGFTFPENFARPYSALSVTDFWRRWHITLSNWFRDYVYIPLGGNRFGSGRTSVNLAAVFLITGVWHGANWTFIVWGVYHGVALLIERSTGQRPIDPAGTSRRPVRRGLVLMVVMVGWVFFRSTSVAQAVGYLAAMAGLGSGSIGLEAMGPISNQQLVALAVGVASFLLPGWFVVGPRLVVPATSVRWPRQLAVSGLGAAFAYSLVVVVSGQFSPFLYFQF